MICAFDFSRKEEMMPLSSECEQTDCSIENQDIQNTLLHKANLETFFSEGYVIIPGAFA